MRIFILDRGDKMAFKWLRCERDKCTNYEQNYRK
jgi:hypothetical protein